MTLYFCNSVVVSAHTYCFPSVHSSKPLQRHWSKQALKIVVWHNSFSIILLFQLDASFFKTKHFTDMLDDQKRQGVQAKCKRSRWDHWREGCPGDVAVPSTARTLSAMLILYIHACLPSWFKHPPLRNYLLDCEFSWPIHRSRCSQFFLISYLLSQALSTGIHFVETVGIDTPLSGYKVVGKSGPTESHNPSKRLDRFNDTRIQTENYPKC